MLWESREGAALGPGKGVPALRSGGTCALCGERVTARRASAYVGREVLGFLMRARPPVGIYGKVFLLET